MSSLGFTRNFLTLPIVLLPLLAVACGSDATDPSGSGGSTQPEGERGPIGKADQSSSCQGAKASYCGGKSAGACWCDDECESFGDCCGDKPTVCDGEPVFCPDGQVETTDVFSDAANGMECRSSLQHCLTPDFGACPQFSPPSPDYCADGTVVAGPDSYIPSADGMECKLRSVHCVTNDWGACPQLSPLPPDFCSGGQVVAGDKRFVPSADGMECELPSVHCVTDDVAACTPSFCPEGTVVTETSFADGSGELECTVATQHCLSNDWGACPQLSPPGPGFCPNGEIVSGAPSYLAAANGMECQMPSLHCVTRDYGACPQLSPLPPDYCADGEIMQGAPTFVASTDGMECQLPSVHCVSGACE